MQHFIGKDLHTRYQVVAWIDEATGEIRKRRLEHEGEEVRKSYAQFPRGAVVGIEATFPALWFERLLAELGHELWVGDAARIRAHEVRDQKHDPRDAENILDLLRTGRFPRIGVPTREERDLRQLLVHRMKQVRELDRAVEEAGREREEVVLLRTHPGVGMVVALAFVLTVGPIERFPNSRKLVSYGGLNPREHSSGGRQRLGAISKQGNTLMRWLRIEAAQTAARFDPELRRIYQRLKSRRHSGVAKVAVARRLAVRLYWMLRTRNNYAQLVHKSGSPSSAVVPSRAGSTV